MRRAQPGAGFAHFGFGELSLDLPRSGGSYAQDDYGVARSPSANRLGGQRDAVPERSQSAGHGQHAPVETLCADMRGDTIRRIERVKRKPKGGWTCPI